MLCATQIGKSHSVFLSPPPLIFLFLFISSLSLFHSPHVFLNIIIPGGSSFKALLIVQVFSESFHIKVPFVCQHITSKVNVPLWCLPHCEYQELQRQRIGWRSLNCHLFFLKSKVTDRTGEPTYRQRGKRSCNRFCTYICTLHCPRCWTSFGNSCLKLGALDDSGLLPAACLCFCSESWC